MTSTKAERDKIDARTRQLVADNWSGQTIIEKLARQFDISLDRARSSVARVQRQDRPKAQSQPFPAPALYEIYVQARTSFHAIHDKLVARGFDWVVLSGDAVYQRALARQAKTYQAWVNAIKEQAQCPK